MIEQCAAMLIGENPSQIDRLWQLMYRGFFYPAGREKLHALGALDMALWDIKGKALGVPVYELLGGLARDHIECYSTGFPGKGREGESDGDGARLYRGGFPRFPDECGWPEWRRPVQFPPNGSQDC
jgi:L-alanine-DL-glutamate epimerase-like enolase superfamily enzyme